MADRYIFPAIFEHGESKEGCYTVAFPDLPGCITEGDSLEEAMYMAKDALHGHLYVLEKDGDTIPAPAPPESIQAPTGAFVTLIEAWMPPVRDAMATKSVNMTVTVPRWLREAGERAGLNFSQELQYAIKERLHLTDKR